MKRRKILNSISVLFVSTFLSGAAMAAGPVVTHASGVCNSTLYQFVDTPLAVQYNVHGEFRVPLPPAGILPMGNCRHLYLEIGSGKGKGYEVLMGKISGATLAVYALKSNARDVIQSLEVKGPEVAVVLMGTPRLRETVQMWFYLTD